MGTHISFPSKAPPGITRTCFVLPIRERNTMRGLSVPAKPAFKTPLPLSITTGWFASILNFFPAWNPRTVQLKMVSKIGNLVVLFNFNGNVYTLGPHWPGVLMTVIVICGGAWINLQMISAKSFSGWTRFVLYFFLAIDFVLTSVFFFLTALSDPGIISQQKSGANADENENTVFIVKSPKAEWYCDECDSLSPSDLRARHCFDCGVCVIEHDVSQFWLFESPYS